MTAARILLPGLVISTLIAACVALPAEATSPSPGPTPTASQRPAAKPTAASTKATKKPPTPAQPKKPLPQNWRNGPAPKPAPLVATATLAPATSNGASAGSRGAASMIYHQLTDLAKLSFNPTNGNAVLTGRLLHVQVALLDANINWLFNTLTDPSDPERRHTGSGADRRARNGAYTYVADDGGWYTFQPDGAGGFITPPASVPNSPPQAGTAPGSHCSSPTPC